MQAVTLAVNDNNISSLRDRYPRGLHFVVGDTHGETKTLKHLMRKISFDPDRDHVYFVGDYNGGGSPENLLRYISLWYQADYEKPGFHLIRGNHEHELRPVYPLRNLPDIIVLRGGVLNYYIVHAGMVASAFRLINRDMEENPGLKAYAYRLDRSCAGFDRPLRQIIWSLKGLYSQSSPWQTWPRTKDLVSSCACIIHGHSPYCFFDPYGDFTDTYGENSLFWEKQHVWFSEDLCSFNIDSNVKGRSNDGENSRGLACMCLEVYEEAAARNGRRLTIGSITGSENGMFYVKHIPAWDDEPEGDLRKLLDAEPRMKTIRMAPGGVPVITG